MDRERAGRGGFGCGCSGGDGGGCLLSQWERGEIKRQGEQGEQGRQGR